MTLVRCGAREAPPQRALTAESTVPGDRRMAASVTAPIRLHVVRRRAGELRELVERERLTATLGRETGVAEQALDLFLRQVERLRDRVHELLAAHVKRAAD